MTDRSPRAGRRLSGLLTVAAAATVLATSVLATSVLAGTAVQAQTIPNPASQIRVVVNIPGQLPDGVTRYRVELRCLNVRGIPSPGSQNLVDYVDRLGGAVTFVLNTQPLTSCRFRLAVEGTGPRPLFGTNIFVGGTARPINVLTSVDGQPVDANTVLETIDLPIEASTEAVWGTIVVSSPTTLPPTTAAPTLPPTTTTLPPTTTTTLPPTTTTTRPPTTTTAPPTVPPTVKPTVAPVRWKVVRTTRCSSKYRFVEIGTNRVVRCLTAAEVRRYVPRG